MRHAEVRQSLYEYVHEELDGSRAKLVEEHLARCNKCFGEYQIIKDAVRLVPRRVVSPSEERSSEFWAHFVAEVEGRTVTERKRAALTHPVLEDLLSFFTYRRPVLAGGAAVAVLFLVAVMLWSTGLLQREAPREFTQAVGDGHALEARTELGDYFRKSEILLVGISNIDAVRGEQIDLSVERQAARQLVKQARAIDDATLDERSRMLVRALERILIELANMEQEADLPDVELVRSGIRQENMLFKIRLAAAEYTPRQRNANHSQK